MIAQAGGIDLQLLGIGSNGHLGFNEPSSSLSSKTRLKTLTSQTRQDNQRFFPEGKVPERVITMGLGTITASRSCVLLALGEAKASAVAATVEGPLSAMVPASVLQLHQRAVVILDEAAASKLSMTDYYREVYETKPEWQRV